MQVKTWFQNRRAKWRRCQTTNSPEEKSQVTSVVPMDLEMNSMDESFGFGAMNKWKTSEATSPTTQREAKLIFKLFYYVFMCFCVNLRKISMYN